MSAPAPPVEIGAFPFGGEVDEFRQAFGAWRNRILDYAVDHPLEALLTLVLGSSWFFYQAERDENPGINSYDDSVYYISTCLSVGYANVFPVTQTGKLIAAVVMMLGPSVTAWVVEGRLTGRAPDRSSDTEAILQRLDTLIALQRSGPGADSAAGQS